MLIAEINGRYVPDAERYEDYLTSAVFGHLRYISPGPFWRSLFARAISLPIGTETISLATHVERTQDRAISEYKSLETVFWPTHPEGEPDILLRFTEPDGSAIAIFVEVKLDAGKSGVGPDDQLARYLRIGDSIQQLHPSISPVELSAVVFLTPNTSPAQLLESLAVYGDTSETRRRLYRLDWQDVTLAAEECLQGESDRVIQRILTDVRAFLRRRGFEHFAGMNAYEDFPVLDLDGHFLRTEWLGVPEIPDDLEMIRGGWIEH